MHATTTTYTDKIVLGLIALILIAFCVGVWQVNILARQVNDVVIAQSSLVFAFETTAPDGTTSTVIVNCNLDTEKIRRYICVTERVRP